MNFEDFTKIYNSDESLEAKYEKINSGFNKDSSYLVIAYVEDVIIEEKERHGGEKRFTTSFVLPDGNRIFCFEENTASYKQLKKARVAFSVKLSVYRDKISFIGNPLPKKDVLGLVKSVSY